MLPEYKKILCATDLGHTAPQVLRHALSIANRYGGDVVVLHVVEPLGPSAQHMFELYAGTEVARQAGERWQKVQDEVRVLVRKFLEREGRPGADGRNLVAEVRVLRGRPFEVIVQEAARLSADLIVMGAHSHTTVGEILLGSTAHRVAQNASAPVMLVRLSEPDGPVP